MEQLLFLRLDKSTHFDVHILKTCRRWMGISGHDVRGLQIRGFICKVEVWKQTEVQRAQKTHLTKQWGAQKPNIASVTAQQTENTSAAESRTEYSLSIPVWRQT